MTQVSRRGNYNSQLYPESFITPQTTEMGSPLINPPHPPGQHHKSTELKLNNLYVTASNEDCAMMFSFALIITVLCT